MRDGLDWGNASYRTCCTGGAWGGFVLSAHIMNAMHLWNHDALFDYVDRYIEIETAEKGLTSAQDRLFVIYTWNAYRKQYGGVWKRTNPSDLYSTGARDYSDCVYNCTRVSAVKTVIGRLTGLRVSPSPMQRNVTFKVNSKNGPAPISIYNSQGRLVKQLPTGTVTWDGTDQQGKSVGPGLYFYNIRSGHGNYSGSIIRTEDR
jgi:hypothetical protein